MATIKKFMKISGQMKNLQRSGWVYHKIENPESDAAHSWSLSLLVQLYAPAELDLCKCLKMANIHDLAEIYVGDFTPGSGIAPEKKHELETDAMRRLVKELDYPELAELFAEFEGQKRRKPCSSAIWTNLMPLFRRVIMMRRRLTAADCLKNFTIMPKKKLLIRRC